MKEIRTYELDIASTIMKYASEQMAEFIEVSYETHTQMFVVKLTCTDLQYERIYGFFEGILR